MGAENYGPLWDCQVTDLFRMYFFPFMNIMLKE